MNRHKKIAFIGAGLLAILVLLLAWRIASNRHAGRDRGQDGPLQVDTAVVKVQPMPVLLQSVGQVQPEHSVQVRPQVSGMLKAVYFQEGQTVSAGQKLFLIDPAPFEAALASAKAAWENAKANADRLEPLAKQDYVTPQEYGDARTAADQAEAAYQQAQINLSYTEIRSPITGRTGSLSVKTGNLVASTDSLPLVVVNQMSPILVQYTIPQQDLELIRRYDSGHNVRVNITREDGTGNLGEGRLVFIDNSVNTDTGTVTLKAEIPNRDVRLWPGQYVGVNTQLAVEPKAVVIPDAAVQTGQNGNFVYVVKNGQADIAPVNVDRQVGDLAVIASGLAGGETVVTRVPRTLRPGLSVSVYHAPAPGSAAPSPDAP